MSAERTPGSAWLHGVAASILDQGLSSGTHFGVSLVVARWTSVEEYGVFAVSFAVHLFAAHAYNELVPEPMTVLAHNDYATCLRSYLRTLLRAQSFLALVFAALLVCAGLVAGSRTRLAGALYSVAAAQLVTLSYVMLRRVAYLRSDATGAAWASMIYAATAGAAILTLGHMSAPLAYLVLALSALTAAAFLGVRLLPRLHDSEPGRGPSLREVCANHYQFARWTLPASLTHALGVHALTPSLAAHAGLRAAGVLRATQNLTTPILQTQAALGILMLPRLSAHRARAGTLSAPVRRFALAMFTLSAVYCALVALFGEQLLAFAYGVGAYSGSAWVLDLLLPAVLLSAISGACSAGLRAARAVRAVFWSKLAAGFAACVIGIPLVFSYRLPGVCWALLCTAAAEALVAAVLFWRTNESHG